MQDTLISADSRLGSSPPVQHLVAKMADTTKDDQRSDSGIILDSTASTEHQDSTVSEEPMDISAQTATSADSDNFSDCSSPSNSNNDTKYFCPICEITLTSQHDFTVHIRSHNNDNEVVTDKGFICRICSKVLSSNSSLDRHMLVHSGERPFTCKYCGDTFTTNGNMHRHMRTHSQKGENNYESDASTDSNNSAISTRKRTEFNNNKVDSKRKTDTINDDQFKTRKAKLLNNNNNINDNTQSYQCPVCERNDFSSLSILEMHMEDNHPDYQVKCHLCNMTFKNKSLHRCSAHQTEDLNNINNKNLRNSVNGFKDLTFTDFSSNKFPHIARNVCEKTLHKPTSGLKFQCEKCSRAFPCLSSLDIHKKDCFQVGLNLSFAGDNPADLSKRSNLDISEKDIRRSDFFARLDLQTNSSHSSSTSEDVPKIKPETVSKLLLAGDTKDLADIQSILSVTSGGSLLQHLQSKTPSESAITPRPDYHKTTENEEESQDVFAAEFRKMKLRGEFPCRLCTAVFPNLRALKGHNRAHLSGNGNGPYRCNMCPYSSLDKAALIRHMRTHNGDRPYECSICNYAFTTKANCERHLRNRHAKVTREEVKKALIYHPSEDPTNEEVAKLSLLDTPKKVSTPYKEAELPPVSIEALNMRSSTPKELNTLSHLIKNDVLNMSIPVDSPILHKDTLSALKDHRITPKEERPLYLPPPFPRSSVNLSNILDQSPISSKIQVKSLEAMKQIPEYDSGSEGEEEYEKDQEPMDMALDLSKKKSPEKPEVEEKPKDFTKKALDYAIPPNGTALLAQQLLKNSPNKLDLNFYASQFSQLYRNAMFTGFPGFPLSNPFPYIFSPPILPQDPELKERLMRMQLSGGGMIGTDTLGMPGNERLPNYPTMKSMHDSKPDIKLSSANADDIKPLHIETQFSDNGLKMQSPKAQPKPDISQSPNSVKMVIKNGVLMPKQKQRRYRTERPFSCEHCSARFTLRSNMERHIKQQHPQFWSQRQRSNIGNVGRKPNPSLPPSLSLKMPYYDSLNNLPNDIPKIQDSSYETKDAKEALHPGKISNDLKYALLAHQLNASQDRTSKIEKITKELHMQHLQKHAEDDDDCALIIDEESADMAKKLSENNRSRILEETLRQPHGDAYENNDPKIKLEETPDLVPVSRLLDDASQQPFRDYFKKERDNDVEGCSEEDEEGLVASGSTSEGNGSGTDENKSEGENTTSTETVKKKSAYSLAPNRVSCPYCHRKFPWTSSLRRHVLTHTGQKPFKCSHCPLLFTTKSNCDRHLLRKHGNVAQTQNTDSASTQNSQNYLMRNVPERPYKCSTCPSSTFSTLSNLKKHMSCKHTAMSSSRPGSPKTDEGRPLSGEGYEAGSSEDERLGASDKDAKSDWENQMIHQKIPASNPDQPSNMTDLPYKCHLCDSSYSERQEALDHIRDLHASEYDLLMSKGALDPNAVGHEDMSHMNDNEDEEQGRGKFPDYANRKVICAFCMRRFWSAEDLRRHMRTHTGERPFSCDICRRRFTLKHSMLRHRKKHTNEENAFASDEDANGNVNQVERLGVNNNNNIICKNEKSEEESEGNEGNDLISKLLGIRDRSIIDQVLVSSADDAAKLLGVKNEDKNV